MKKIIAVISIIAIICCLCSAVNAAEEGADVDISTTAAVTSSETVVGSVESATETAPVTPGTTNVGAPDAEPGETDAADQSWGTYMGRLVKWAWVNLLKWWDKIVATIAATILTIIYRCQKDKIVPNMQSASSGVSKSIATYDEHKKAWEKKIVQIINQARSFTEEANKKIELAFETIKAVFVTIEKLEEKHLKSEIERDVVYAIMLNQNATLHTIIQSSTLAQWKKEEIGKIYAENMKLLTTMKEHQFIETTQSKEESKEIYENCKKQIEENCEKLFKISEPVVAFEDGEESV